MSNKRKVKINYALEHKSPGIEYSIRESYHRAELMYYITVMICKNGIAYQCSMSSKERGFKTVEVATAAIRVLLYREGRNTSIEKDVRALPVFNGEFQTAFKF